MCIENSNKKTLFASKFALCALLSLIVVLLTSLTCFASEDGSYSVIFESGLDAGQTAATVSYKPANNEISSFTGVLALYNSENKLLSAAIAPSEVNVSLLSLTNTPDTHYAKVFIWDTENPLTPLAEPTIFTKNDTLTTQFLDFTVDVETGREPRILHLTDTQIIDASQERYEDRLGATLDAYYAKDKMNERCFNYLRETITATNPDLILLTGDLVYGSFDDNGTAFTKLIEVMESFDIPWAPVFGNHENESEMGADWQAQQLENAPNCLFKQRTLTGNSNYTVGITQGGELKRVFFMLDSNGCGAPSEATTNNGHTKTSVGFAADQIAWYTDVATKINHFAPHMKYTFAYHIQQEIFRTALSKYGTINSNTINSPIRIDTSAIKAETDFGYIGRDLKGAWDTNFSIYNGMKALGCDSHLVGHEHCNSASVVYDGTRFQYGQKSSTYDRANYLKSDGTIVGSYSEAGTAIIGGTVMTMSETNGSFSDSYIYYCNNVNPNPEPAPEPEPDPENIVVPGMKFGEELSADATYIDAKAVEFNGVAAYEVTATSQAKVLVDVSNVANADTFTFSLYLPSTSSNKLSGKGELSLRIKPNDIEPQIDGTTNGYIDYKTNTDIEDIKLVFDQWKTYTVDISDLGTKCTEFSFVIPTGNTIYLKDLAVHKAVHGLSFDSAELSIDPNSDATYTTASIGGKNAYAITANGQSKVHVKPALVANKSKFTFSVYLPSTSSNILSGKGEFSIRTKPNDLDPQIDGSANGYIDYKTNTSYDAVKLEFDKWKTYTVDISAFGSKCTEFSFVIPAGNVIYLNNLTIE